MLKYTMTKLSALVLAHLCFGTVVAASDLASALATCKSIAGKITGASDIIYAANPNYAEDINHWFVSSTQAPACVLEAGSVHDVAAAMKIIGQTRTPFAVKSGGHASNPGFSSTPGVQISFQKMTQVQLSNDKSTVEIGMGQSWGNVYPLLQGSGVNVVGGRVPGPGVGGFTLGGGYSWLTNQYGLTFDSLKSATLVLPNGTITTVDSSQPDLFFALKGGLNRFGVVTAAQYFTKPQVPLIYGGLAIYGSDTTNAVLNATEYFNKHNTDPKAQIITTISGSTTGSSILALFFYDGPNRPASFAPFDNINPLVNDIKQQSFSDFVSGAPSAIAEPLNQRGRFNSLNTNDLTPKFLAAIKNQSDYWGSQMVAHQGVMISYDVEPFLKTYGKHDTGGAYPHADSPLPLNLYFSWLDALEDDFWIQAIEESLKILTSVAEAEGILTTKAIAYPNYAVAGTSAANMYGAANAARLRAIQQKVDPHGIMQLAGGFTF